MAKQQQQEATVDASRLTDAEADYLLAALVGILRDRVPETVFYRAFGRGLVYGSNDATRERARNWVRLIAHGE